MAASANPILADKGQRDPTLVCTGYKKPRFYLFTRSEPEYALLDRFDFTRFISALSPTETSLATGMFSMSDPPAMNRALQLRLLVKHAPAHHH